MSSFEFPILDCVITVSCCGHQNTMFYAVPAEFVVLHVLDIFPYHRDACLCGLCGLKENYNVFEELGLPRNVPARMATV